MALFDRRLLAYFDDGCGAGGSMTLLDRMTDYQRDLAEIERELAKYQLLLGSRQVQLRHRDRDSWIAKNREPKSIKERYRRVVQEAMGEVDAPVHVNAPHDRGHAASTGSSKNPRSGARRSSLAHKVTRRPSQEGQLRTVWVQVDSVLEPPGSSHSASRYVVRADWQHAPGKGAETEEKAAVRQDDGQEKVLVRQQLSLKGRSTTSFVTCGLYSKQDGKETLLGDVSLDSAEAANHEVGMHQLHDQHGRPLTSTRTDSNGRHHPTILRVRMSNPEVQDEPGAASSRDSQSSSKHPASASEAGAGDAERSARSSLAKDEPERRSSVTVTQDPAAAPASERRPSTAASSSSATAGLAAVAATGTGAAAATALAGASVEREEASLGHASAESPRETPGATPVTPGFTEPDDEAEELLDEGEEEEEEEEYDEEEEEEEDGEGDEEA